MFIRTNQLSLQFSLLACAHNEYMYRTSYMYYTCTIHIAVFPARATWKDLAAMCGNVGPACHGESTLAGL
jgi:hypothetical protein